ncbi:MAG: hypothetical protein H7Z72_22490 [Bacteroidetes bacterium]|nr:hypothetical protein [Fibrella sp.]
MKMNFIRVILVAFCFIWSGRALSNSPLPTDSLTHTLNQAKHFKGLLDLPFPSFHYALSGISDSSARTFVQYGLAEIYFHPDRAMRYSRKLQYFLQEHPAKGTDQAETFSYADSYVYGSPRTTRHSPESFASSSVPELAGNQSPKTGIDWLITRLPGPWIFSMLWFTLSATCTILVIALLTMYLVARKGGTTFTFLAHQNQPTRHP